MGPAETWPLSLRSVVQMMLHQRQAICLFWGDDLNMLYNDAYAPLLGAKERDALGKPFRDIWSDVWNDVKPFVDMALGGEGTYAENMRLMMFRNGFEEETYFTFSYSPLFDDDGRVRGLINVTVETTQAVLAQRTQQVMRRELMHRVKNSLAVTSSVISATLRQAPSLEVARETITRRLAALADAQNLFNDNADSAEVDVVLRAALRAHLDHSSRVSLSGPGVKISSQQAIGLSLAAYELATNAMKYGALSVDGGRIDVSWNTHGRRGFSFTWQESGGPPVEPPTRSGFGSRLTNRIVAAYFSGEGRTHYDRDGLRFELNGQLA
ncbi:sensor histidine kinase [Aquibium carbonis]|nr:PAS domain-containing sensor histidine kinase [Aquibium carbonis]